MLDKNIVVIKTETLNIPDYKIKRFVLDFPKIERTVFCIGIDPGTTNFGFSILQDKKAFIYQASFKREANPVFRMKDVFDLLEKLFWLSGWYPKSDYKVCVEGASFGDVYRQVELAEIRAASVFWALKHFQKEDVIIIPPSKIRKKVFGNGSIIAKDLWKGILPGDAADSLACAYYLIDFNNISRSF